MGRKVEGEKVENVMKMDLFYLHHESPERK